MLLGVAARAGAEPEDAAAAGREQGRAEALAVLAAIAPETACADALVDLLARLGFDPARIDDDEGGTTVGFARCPFQELAEANPDLVCALHRGVVEGFVEAVGGADITAFGTLVDRHPCRVELARR
jgi:predicted ArsR family transcriptional regulator